MSNFSATAIEALEYDFTGFRSETNKKAYCSGKGPIPEPSKAHLEAYSKGLRDYFGIEKGQKTEEAQKAITEIAEKETDATSEKLLELTSALCSNAPSVEELKELPPRIRTAFQKWVQKELSDPEV